MSRFHSYILSASKIIDTYDGAKPLTHHLKAFFAAEKKYGSRDRKTIASLCYCYYRTGKSLKNASVEDKILTGLFLSENKSNDLLALLRPGWNEQVSLAVTDKLSMLTIPVQDVFPFMEQLSPVIDKELFALSFLKQPDLFLRLRPGKTNSVTDKLQAAAIPFETISSYCLRLHNNTSLDTVLNINKEAVIQDYNSQQVFNFLEKNPAYFSGTEKISAWDCCAASGGKSLLLYDVLKGNVKLTVSDIRENILANLEKRLAQAGINIYKKFVIDLSVKTVSVHAELFQLIVCDAPCTGSGTWSRTPEQLFYFNKNTVATYVDKQKKIVSATIPQVAMGGLFFYITCSVFQAENENIVKFIQEKSGMRLLQMEYLSGYALRADTMFVAVFCRG